MALFTPETAMSYCKRPFTPEIARELNDRTKYPRKPKPKIIAPKCTENTYTAIRLRRIRRQLKLVDDRIEEEASKDGKEKDGKPTPMCDGQLLNWLCSAQERLSEQERILANRPLPGSLRPTDTKRSHSQPLPEPSPTPQPVVEPTSITPSTSVIPSDSKPAN